MKVDISYSSVFKMIGRLLIVLGIMLLVPLAVELIDGEKEWRGFVTAIAICTVTGGGLWYWLRDRKLSIGRREGFMLVTLVWIVYSAIGMIPYMMSKGALGFSDAYFETMSGFTTTGATVIADVEGLSKGVLLWRSMTQWIGGLGIILFMLAVLPSLDQKGGVPLYNAETTGITHDKLHPQIRQTATTLWIVYIGLTIALIVLLWAGPMNLFDSICQAFTAISTGGFSTRNAGIAYWDSDYVNVVLTVFMLLGGVNFALIYAFCRGRFSLLLKNDVFRAYLFLIAVAYVGLAVSLFVQGRATSVSDTFIQPMFHVVSTITTTGFGLPDYASWGPFCLLITFLLMLSGACAGSTTGAIKVDRLVAMYKNLKNQISRTLYPNRIYLVRVNGVTVSPDDVRKMHAFITLYIILTVTGALVLSGFGISLDDSFFAVISCIGDNGLGYGLTGVAGGYHFLPDSTKWVLSFLMLAGRLELYTVLVFFFASFWKK